MFMRFVWFSDKFVYSNWETDKEMVRKVDPQLILVYTYKRKLDFDNYKYDLEYIIFKGKFNINTENC